MNMWQAISRILPEGMLKQKLRKIFYGHVYELYRLGLVKGSCDHEKYYKLQKGDTVVNAGANVGLFTIKAAKEVGNQGRVVAIEPDADNVEFLERNVNRAGLKNVIIVPKGLWRGKDKLKLYLAPSPGLHSLIKKTESGFVIIEVDTLDNILRELGIKKVDFVKMDIEGAEIQALKGMQEVLQSSDVKLAIEADHEINGEKTVQTVISLLRQMQFEVHEENSVVYASKQLQTQANSKKDICGA